MDRHICRAKDINTGEWVYGYYFERKDIMGNIIESVIIENAYEQIYDGRRLLESMFNKECFRVDPETVCQCAGLSDKNGTIIFENDCIGHKLNVVEYFDGSFCVNGDTPLCYMNKYYQVVGNKFDYGVLNNG